MATRLMGGSLCKLYKCLITILHAWNEYNYCKANIIFFFKKKGKKKTATQTGLQQGPFPMLRRVSRHTALGKNRSTRVSTSAVWNAPVAKCLSLQSLLSRPWKVNASRNAFPKPLSPLSTKRHYSNSSFRRKSRSVISDYETASLSNATSGCHVYTPKGYERELTRPLNRAHSGHMFLNPNSLGGF